MLVYICDLLHPFDMLVYSTTLYSMVCIIQLHMWTMLLVYMWSFWFLSISIYDHTTSCVDDCNTCTVHAYSSWQQCSKCVYIYLCPYVSIHSTILPQTSFIACTNLVMITSTPCDPRQMKWLQKELNKSHHKYGHHQSITIPSPKLHKHDSYNTKHAWKLLNIDPH